MTAWMWEQLALAAALLTGGLHLLLRRRPPAWTPPPRLAALLRATRLVALSRAAGRVPAPLLDLAWLALGLAVCVPPVLARWSALSPWRSPMGADADGNYLAAAALARGDLALYAGDRYPAYPALVVALARSVDELHLVGATLSAAAILGALALVHTIARQVGGRAAGLVALALAARLPGPIDAGRQFTPYALVAFADLLVVAGLLGLARASAGARLAGGAAVALGSAAAFTADPKQAPVALAAVGIGAALALGGAIHGGATAPALAVHVDRPAPRPRGARLASLVAGALVLAALPVANAQVAAAELPVLSIADITTRVRLDLVIDPALGREGWTLGDPLSELPSELLRIARLTGVEPTRGWLAPVARASLPMELPRTSPAWLVAAALAVAPWAWGRLRPPDAARSAAASPAPDAGRRAGRRPAAGPIVLLSAIPVALVAVSALHLHFQHRYFVPVGLLLCALVAGGIARVAGPAAVVAAGLVALLHPASPWSTVGPGLGARPSREAEPWAGQEPPDWTRIRGEAAAALPADAVVLDFAQSRPWTMLAGARPYARCTSRRDTCRGLLEHPTGSLVAVLYPGEQVSASVPEAAPLETFSQQAPETLGACWRRVFARGGEGGVYAWTCMAPPQLPPPPPPTPNAARPGDPG